MFQSFVYGCVHICAKIIFMNGNFSISSKPQVHLFFCGAVVPTLININGIVILTASVWSNAFYKRV